VLTGGACSAVAPTAVSEYYIGYGYSNGYGTDGIIDNVRIYNRALTAEEVMVEFTTGY